MVSHIQFIDILKNCAAAKLLPAQSQVFAKLIKTALFQKVSQEASGSFLIHSSTGSVTFVLALADSSYLRISCLRMHEYQSAYACVRCHRVAFCHLDSESTARELILICMTVFVTVALAAATAVVTVHFGTFSKKCEDVLLERVVRAA